jgi:3-hydroxyisobutyrate dehydrogenase-like beta-hydroxyacid dehydrogenase
MGDTTIGLLHPGEMGAAVGRCLAGAGHRVLWVPEGRGPASAARAEAAEVYRRYSPAERAGDEAGLDALVRNSPDRSDEKIF